MNKEKFAKIITVISTPFLVWAFFFGYLFYYYSADTDIFLKTLFLGLFFIILLPAAFILRLYLKGKLTNLHIKVRKQRLVPFIFSLFSVMVFITSIRLLRVNPELFSIVIIYFLMAVGFVMVTLKYKLSGHAFAFVSSVIILSTYIDQRFIFLLPLVLVIAWSRIRLNEHTPKEVLAGTLYAIVSFYLLRLFI